MSYREVSESTILYICVIVGLLVILAITGIYMKKCMDSAKEFGITKGEIKKVISSSVTFSIVPSISIVAGLVALCALIGTPYAWFRLSVLGSLAYETMSANMALSSLGLDATTATADAFGVIMWAMCIAITVGNIFNLFFIKKIHVGSVKLSGNDSEWGIVSQGIFMQALLIVMLMPLILGGGITTATLVVSALLAIIIGKLSQMKNMAWLSNFTLSFSMLGAMAVAVMLEKMF